MNEMIVHWAGWNTEGTSDKIWGYMQVGTKFYSFWGRRGKSVSFKELGQGEARETRRSKMDRGYRTVNVPQELDKIWPTYKQDITGRFTWCVIANKIR